ncbi:hypothetical protein M0813_26298 [Anaeramoeba flamelloides]|uniref:Uncharacterized protein n=1 Tax=Anaeramoeba flamelloides TaxID=1746091 RepID=A0ABQ8Y0E2_9EUKA|nr:hypothetical protein M0813_26298 [Anaeramoeba flamelloides]
MTNEQTFLFDLRDQVTDELFKSQSIQEIEEKITNSLNLDGLNEKQQEDLIQEFIKNNYETQLNEIMESFLEENQKGGTMIKYEMNKFFDKRKNKHSEHKNKLWYQAKNYVKERQEMEYRQREIKTEFLNILTEKIVKLNQKRPNSNFEELFVNWEKLQNQKTLNPQVLNSTIKK